MNPERMLREASGKEIEKNKSHPNYHQKWNLKLNRRRELYKAEIDRLPKLSKFLRSHGAKLYCINK